MEETGRKGIAMDRAIEGIGLAVPPVLCRREIVAKISTGRIILGKRRLTEITQINMPAAQHIVTHFQNHGLAGRNVQDRVGPEPIDLWFIDFAGLFVFILFTRLDDFVGAGPGKVGAIQPETDIADSPVGNAHFTEVFGHIIPLEAIGSVGFSDEIDRETVIHMDMLRRSVLQPVRDPDCGIRNLDADIEVFPDNLYLRHFERNRIAGPDSCGVGNDRIAIGVHQCRKKGNRKKAEQNLFHGNGVAVYIGQIYKKTAENKRNAPVAPPYLAAE